ncbi:hypothetical protein ACOMHN_058989 [Nucella lapillus]
MYKVIGDMEVVGLSREEGLLISWRPDGLGLELSQQKLESVKRQYEAEMEALRQQLEGPGREDSSNHHVDQQLQSQYQQAVVSLREALQDSERQQELDAVVGQLQELHHRQLQHLSQHYMHDTALQVTAMRVTVEQVQESRLRLLEEQHCTTLQQLDKQHKEQINTLHHSSITYTSTPKDGPPLGASEELMQQYQNLVQRINQSLEKEVLSRLGGDENSGDDSEKTKTNDASSTDTEEGQMNAVPSGPVTKGQVEAIQQTLHAQQEEVLSLRSRLLQDYEGVLQQRTEGVSQQTAEVQRLQDQMAKLQSQYEQQIAEFQARISQHDEEEEHRHAEQQKHAEALEEMKARYEQRVADMEESFSKQIAALQQTAAASTAALGSHHKDVTDAGDSGAVFTDHADSDPENSALRLEQEREYVHKTATLTAISDLDSDTADSPRSQAADPDPDPDLDPSSRLRQLQSVVEEKNARVLELEQRLEQEGEKMKDLVSQLDAASLRLSDLSSQLQEQSQLSQRLQDSVRERDSELQQALSDKAESQKLYQELLQKETWLQKDKDNLEEELKCLKELDDALLTSTPTVEGELKQLRTSLEETTSALREVEAREAELREQLSEVEHQHADALEELRQELEHEAQMERETLQSEFQVQLDVELKRQAAELERRFSQQVGQAAINSDIPGRTFDEVDAGCAPDVPHQDSCVQAVLTASLNVPTPTSVNGGHVAPDHAAQEAVINGCVHGEHSPSPQPEACDSAEGHLPPSGATNGHVGDSVAQQTAGHSATEARLTEVCQRLEAERSQLVLAHERRVQELETLLRDAEDKYNQLKEDVEEREGAGVETLVKDRYDLELDLAKNLMQQEFDDTLQAEKKKFVERHRTLMDDFMADRESEATEIKEKHEQELNDLHTQITQLQSQLELLQTSDSNQTQNGETVSPAEGNAEEELSRLKSGLEEERQRVETLQSDHAQTLASLKELETVKEQSTESLRELQGAQTQLYQLRTEHASALATLQNDQETRILELKQHHQEELEAVALDTDVVKSELEQAHQAELQQLKEQLRTPQGHSQQETPQHIQPQAQTVTKEEATTLRHARQSAVEGYRPGPETMYAVSEITMSLHLHSPKSAVRGSRDGFASPEVSSSLEYEEADTEEGSSSSTPRRPHSFAEVVKSPPPSSPRQDHRIKQLEAQVERLTQQLAQQQDTMTVSPSMPVASPPPSLHTTPSTITASPPQGATPSPGHGAEPSLIHMLQSDLERISAERDTIHQTNNRLLQLLSDSVHTYVEVEDTINRRLHTVVTASSSFTPLRPHTPTTQPPRPDVHGDFATPRGAGLTSFMGMAGDRGAVGGAAAGVSSPQSDRSWRHREADTGSPTLEETSILSSATDEGLDISQRITESIFMGPDIDAEGEEIVSDARGRLQTAVSRLLEMIERTMQQLVEARNTQTDLLDTMATRARDSDDLAARLKDLEEQVRQEVAAKEYLGLELHKAEGLIGGYSSEREGLEEQLQSLEEQKEGLASELETTRSRLQDFQEATGELEARRLDVERQQSLLQDHAGLETQESAMAGGDATVTEQKALLKELDSVKQQTREHTLQLQHRLAQAEESLQEREAQAEEQEKEQQRQSQDLRRQLDDLRLQLDNTDRQLKANKQFLDEQMTEREQEREEFIKEVDRLKDQLHDKEKHTDSEGRLQREVQDLTEQLQARIESQSVMHQQTRELQQSLQERDLSAQDLRVWIDTLERELDQRGDAEEQLKGRIQKLERRLTIGEGDSQSDTSASPVLTPRPVSPSSLPLSPPHPVSQHRQSRISLEDELRKSRQSGEELVHEKDALQRTVQEQLLQISALRNQLDEMRHWTGTPDPNASSTSAADLREQLDTEREKLEKMEEEVKQLRTEQEALQAEIGDRTRETEQLQEQLKESAASTSRLKGLEEERDSLQAQVTELSNVGPFPPELLDEKNAEIEELQQKLSKTETEYGSLQAELKEKEELVSDLQDTVHSLQRGEAFLDVSLPFNEPLPLNASFTERTSLAQELDQTVGEQESRINELAAEVEQLTEQLTQQQDHTEQLQQEKTTLEAELHQRDDDFTQLQEEKNQKQEALAERESRLQQLVEQINSLQTEINSLNSFQGDLQKDFDTVQSMLEEKEGEIESLTKELLESRSQTEDSDVSDLEAELAAVQRQLREQRNVVDEKEEELYELNEKLEAMETLKGELQSLKTRLADQTAQWEQEQKTNAHLQSQLADQTAQWEQEQKTNAHLQSQLADQTAQWEQEQKTNAQLQSQLEKEGKSRTDLEVDMAEKLRQLEEERRSRMELQQEREEALGKERPLEEQVRELREEVSHLEGVLKDKEQLLETLQEEKATDGDLKDKDLANLRQQLQDLQDTMAARITEMEAALADQRKAHEAAVRQKEEELTILQQRLQTEGEAISQLETQQHTLRQQAEDHRATITTLQREVALLTQQLEEAKRESTATDDVKALQERLQQTSQQAGDLQQEVLDTHTRLTQTATQLTEREEQIQQLQAEMQSLYQESQRLRDTQASDSVAAGLRTPESLDSETEDRLKDVLSQAQHLHSLSASLPISPGAEAPSLCRWESEPGLSSSLNPEIAAKALDTQMWLRRQQLELASKNRELAAVRQVLESWLRRKHRTAANSATQFTASVMSVTLRLQEKETLIASLKRELGEAKELLAKTERAAAGETPSPSPSQPLSPQTKQQISHLRSELRRAKAALAAIQEGSAFCPDEASQEDCGDTERIQALEAELHILRASSAEDFAERVEDLRQELSEEHRRHVHDLQEAARQDLELKLTELQSRHDKETQQLQQQHERRLQQALAQLQQELEKQHKTELNSLRVMHQQEVDRLRSEELASLMESTVAQQLHADVVATQQLDRNLIGRLTSENETSEAGSDTSELCPSHIQALLDRVREAGEHILSVSELELLQRHLGPSSGETDSGVKEAWEVERRSLVKTLAALKQLLGQADRVRAGLEEGGSDWRSELIQTLVEVYRQERLALEAELHRMRLQQPQLQREDVIKNFDNRLHEQEQLHQTGLDTMLRADRQSLLSELEQLRIQLSEQRQERQDLQARLTQSLSLQEEKASNNSWKLQREVQMLEYKLKEEKVIEEDLRKGLECERRRVAELSSELSRDKGTLITVQAELQSTQLHLSRTKDALEREQNRFTSVTDALEEEREKNTRLADMLEAVRRQHSSLESDVGRSEAIHRERNNAESKFIKELQSELASERDQLHRVVEVGEEERRQRKQVEGELEREQHNSTTIRQELDKLRRQMKKSLDQDSGKLSDMQRLLHQEHEKVQELQHALADRESTLLQHSHRMQQLEAQLHQQQTKCQSVEREVEMERQKAEGLVTLMDSERQQQLKLQQQELALTKQLRTDLAHAKTEASENWRQLEAEKSGGNSLRLELDKAQSELRAFSQHAGATERQLETEQGQTWSKLQLAHRERDQLTVKGHELELELDRLQDRLRDLELELDRSRQRELEARHDVERHKLYPSASPRSAPTTPRGDSQLQIRLNTFCQQLQHVGRRLQTLTLQQRDLNVSGSVESDSRGGKEAGRRQAAVEELMAELHTLQQKMASGEQGDTGSATAALTQEVEQLQTVIRQLRTEKDDLRRRLSLLEDEDNLRTPRSARSVTIHSHRHQETMPQYVSDVATSDDEVIYECTAWAGERMKLQLALDSAEHEIDNLKKELRSFRGHFNAEGFMVEADRGKMQRLYGKYLRAESFRKALVYQKRYLLLLLGGYQDSEQETLAIIATMGGQPSSALDLALRRRHRRLYTIFRSAARMVVAIFRMKYLVRKWKRAMRVGSPVVSGRVNQQYGYVATPSSFSPANNAERQPGSATSAYVHTLQRQNVSHLCNGQGATGPPNAMATLPGGGDAGRQYFTPPTKEFSQSHRASESPASSTARRQLMEELNRSHQSSSGSSDMSRGGAAAMVTSHDDYIQRLENLRSRLSSSQNAEASPRQSSWR